MNTKVDKREQRNTVDFLYEFARLLDNYEVYLELEYDIIDYDSVSLQGINVYNKNRDILHRLYSDSLTPESIREEAVICEKIMNKSST